MTKAHMGFVIQGGTPLCPLKNEKENPDNKSNGVGDNELPERLFGCIKLQSIDPNNWVR